MPGNPDWRGITPLSSTKVAINETVDAVSPGSPVQFTASMQGTGYEIHLEYAQTTAIATNSPVLTRLTWMDHDTGAVIESQSWWVIAGSLGSPHIIVGHGPSAANVLQVNVINGTTGAPDVSAVVQVVDVSRPYTHHDLRTDDTAGVSYPGTGIIAATSDMLSGILNVQQGLPVPAGNSVIMVLPLFAGLIQTRQFEYGASSMDVLHQAFAYFDASLNHSINDQSTDDSVSFTYQTILPRIQCAINVSNGDGANDMSLNMYVVAQMD